MKQYSYTLSSVIRHNNILAVSCNGVLSVRPVLLFWLSPTLWRQFPPGPFSSRIGTSRSSNESSVSALSLCYWTTDSYGKKVIKDFLSNGQRIRTDWQGRETLKLEPSCRFPHIGMNNIANALRKLNIQIENNFINIQSICKLYRILSSSFRDVLTIGYKPFLFL